KEGPRFKLGISAYALGHSYRDLDDTKARFYLELSKSEASKVKDKSTVGAALTQLARIENNQGNYVEGEKKAEEAARLLIGEDNLDWYEIARMVQAKALMHSGRLKEALTVLEKVLPAIPERQVWQKSGYEIQFEIYEKMGLHKGALESLKVLRDIEKKESSEKEQANFAKAKVDLGLQLEEQKNLLLQKENELQAARLKTSRYLLIAAIALGILLVGAVASTSGPLPTPGKFKRPGRRFRSSLM
ncbi:MAG TPA: hypothetical protein VE954_29425, partial [Oligoflexus sp.]|uniref:hypothetical protein n=1 Tax=Oligoflexus sp. TaxID=1971216 RepID=UPI002D559A42